MRIYTPMDFIKWASAAILVIALTGTCFAQQSGYRDLTVSWRAPDDHIPSPPSETCPSVKSTISDGVMLNGSKPQPTAPDPDKLEFTITEVAPAKLRVGENFTASVRVKNTGASVIRVPWQPDGEEVTRVSQDGTEEEYEVADVSFRLKTGDKKPSTVPLHSEGALFAHPGDLPTYFEIDPGRWIDVKLQGRVACELPQCVSGIQPDDHAILTAWWYQRVLTHRVKDCSEDHGSYTVREVDSAPLAVVVRSALPPGGHGANR